MKQIRTLLGIFCAIAACVTQNQARAEGHHQSGISGQVFLDQFGSRGPVQCFVSIGSESGKDDQIIQTDEDGLFWLALKPGKYFLTPFTNLGLYLFLIGPEVTVIVDKKGYSDVQLTIPLPPPIRPPVTPITPPDDDPGSGSVGILPIIPILPPGAGTGVIIQQPVIPVEP